ncbi:hypothetical protein LguiA_034913 [Lonicera macranthoides]
MEIDLNFEFKSSLNPKPFFADCFFEWNVRAPLEVIYEAYEGEEEDENDDVLNEKQDERSITRWSAALPIPPYMLVFVGKKERALFLSPHHRSRVNHLTITAIFHRRRSRSSALPASRSSSSSSPTLLSFTIVPS